MKKILLSLTAAFCLSLTGITAAPSVNAAAAEGSITGAVYTHGSERGMKIASNPDASAGGISWDLAAPKRKFHDKEADVWLIGRDFTYDKLSEQEIKDWYRHNTVPKDAPVYHTETDKKTGEYAFQNIPEGTYFLVILDSYGRDSAQNLTELDDKQQLMKKLPDWDSFELFNVGPRSCLVQMVTVKAGETIHIKPGVL
ncbi:hypothetical protein [Mitsuokella sp.]|uniref:hypothetical protein n=1 Tax=Mitsuokella sp. TaxID=2049034 RepID=UPI003D7CBF8F